MPRVKKETTVEAQPTVPTLYRVTLTITEDMLGTAPADPDIYSKYVATKAFEAEKKLAKTEAEKAAISAKEEALTREELAQLPEDGNGKGITVFRRDGNGLVLTDFMVRGHLKEAAQAVGLGGSTWGLTSKIDRFVFVVDENRRPVRTIPIMRDGVQVKQPDGIFERPLRAMTMQGPRVTLAASEMVKAPVTLTFYLYVVGLGATEKGKITDTVLRSWLEYGRFTGLGQYRTGGYGRFEVDITVVE